MTPIRTLKTSLLLAGTTLLVALAGPALGQAPAPDRAVQFRTDIANPLTVAIHHSMEQRASRLVKFYEPGAIGLAKDGKVAAVGDTFKYKIGTRQIIEKLIDAENGDRRQFVAALALANGDGNDLTRAQAACLARWRSEMKPGWMVQDDAGVWAAKP